MRLSETQLELLGKIQSKIRRGDITVIAKKTGFSKRYVGMVLSASSEDFNQDIINEMVEIISTRQQNTKNNLEKITA